MPKGNTLKADSESNEQPNNPLHGLTLEKILTILLEHYSWKEMNQKVELNCFFSHPSIKSSLTFLRKNDWARKKVENLYLQLVESMKSSGKDFPAKKKSGVFPGPEK